MVCDGAMHLYNFLVDYRDAHDIDYNDETMIFNNNFSDNGHSSVSVGNDSVRPAGIRSLAEVESRLKGLRVMDILRHTI